MHIYTLNNVETGGSSFCYLNIIKLKYWFDKNRIFSDKRKYELRQLNLNSFIKWTFQIGVVTIPPSIENTPHATCI